MIYLVTNSPQLFKSDHYEIISIEESINMISQWDIIQYDSETTGLDCHIDKILCFQIGNKDANIQFVIDVSTVDIQLYKNILENIPMVGQNLKFDLQFLYKHNIIPLEVYDIMIVEQLLHLGYPNWGSYGGISYSLDSIAKRYLNISISKDIRDQIVWRGLDTEVILYAANDVKYLEDIMHKQLEVCKNKNCLKAAKLECDFVPAISYLEWCGIRLDEDKWLTKMQKDKEKLAESKKALDDFIIAEYEHNLVPFDFVTINLQGDLFDGFDSDPKCTVNWSSSKQVVKVAQYLGFNTRIIDKKTGGYKDTVLEKYLKSQKGINDEFLKKYFDYQENAKVVSTYGQNYLNAINPLTGRIHTVFRQLGADSGRMACGSSQSNRSLAKLKKMMFKEVTYPQLQNLPANKETRHSFVPNPGNVMCSCDYSAMESRLGADIYEEPAMREEYLHGSGDIHSLVAKACFPELKDVPVKDIASKYPKLRNKAKPITFAIQFGGSAYAVASSLNISTEEAQLIMDAYLSNFKGISEFKKKGSKFVKKHGYVLINKYTGHKLYWWDHDVWLQRQKKFTPEFWDLYRTLKEKDPTDYEVKEVSIHYRAGSKWDRMALNAPTQGSGAIIIKLAVTNFFKWLVLKDLFGIVLLCNMIHDEVVIEYPKEYEGIHLKLQKYMEEAADKLCKSLPIPAVASIGNKWL